jgi:flavorubredoxin
MANNLIKESYQKNKEKYDRRNERFFMKMEHSNKILIVWYSIIEEDVKMMENVSDNIKIEMAEKLQKEYPNKTIHYLFFEHSDARGKGEIQKIYLNKNILIIKSNHSFSQNVGKIPESMEMFLSKIKLNDELFY